MATGRASASQDLSAEEYEEVFRFLYDLSKTALFDIKTTEAQHYRRYVAQQRKAEGPGPAARTKRAPRSSSGRRVSTTEKDSCSSRIPAKSIR